MVGEGTLFGDDGRWSEPLTALLRSAQSRVSSGAPLDVACEDTLTSLYSVLRPREKYARTPAFLVAQSEAARAFFVTPLARRGRTYHTDLMRGRKTPEGSRVGVSSQAASRVARDRLGARSRAQAASGVTGWMRVSEHGCPLAGSM